MLEIVSSDGAELKRPCPTKLQEEIGLAKNKGPLSSVIPSSGHNAGHGCVKKKVGQGEQLFQGKTSQSWQCLGRQDCAQATTALPPSFRQHSSPWLPRGQSLKRLIWPLITLME